MGLLRWPWLRWLALLAALALGLWLWRAGAAFLQHWGEWLSSGGTLTSLAGRQEVWSRALYMTQDFPFTGIGLGTFDRVQLLLYPFFLSAGLVHHAHNLFLQVAVDLGLPGLIAYLALWLGSFHSTWQAYRVLSPPGNLRNRVSPRNPISEPLCERVPPWLPSLALGLFGSQMAMTLHGLLDTPVWANKLAFLPWFAFGLSAALWKWTTSHQKPGFP
jgi:putative inorganic carbon (HCO3(-)) transporter